MLSKQVIKNFITYAFGAVLLRGMTMLMAPINMRILTPSDYGMLALINSFISIAAALMGFGLRQVLSIEYFHGNIDARKTMVNTVLVIYLLLATPCMLALLYLHPYVKQYVFLNAVATPLVILSISITFVYFFVELFYQVLQYEQRAALLTSIQTSIALCTAGIQLTLLWHYKLGVLGIIFPQFLSMVCATTIGYGFYTQQQYYLHRTLKKSIAQTTHYLKLGLPFIPSVLFGWILASIDRWLLAYHTSMHDVGIYAIADTFGQLFNLLVLIPWGGSYLPYIMNQYTQNKDNLAAIEQQNQRVMWVSMASMAVLVTIGYALSKPLLRFVLPSAYHGAINYIWIILMGYIFLMGSYFAASFIQFHKKSYFLAFALCIPALLNMVINYLLIPYYGLYGCTGATLASYITYFCITLFYYYRLR